MINKARTKVEALFVEGGTDTVLHEINSNQLDVISIVLHKPYTYTVFYRAPLTEEQDD
jgi:hypothetical protein